MTTKEIQEYNPYLAQGRMLSQEIESFEIKEFSDLTKADELLKKCQGLKKEIETKRVEIVKPLNDQVKQVNSMAKEVSIPVEEAEMKIKSKLLERNKKQEEIRIAKENKVKEAIRQVQVCKTIAEIEALSFDINDPRIESEKLLKRGEIERSIREEEERKKRDEEERRLAEIQKRQSEEESKLAAERVELDRQKRELEEEKRRIEDEKKQAELKEQEEKKAKLNQVASDASKVKGVRKLVKFEIIDENIVPRSLCSPDEKKIREFVKNGVKEIPGIRVWEEDAVR